MGRCRGQLGPVVCDVVTMARATVWGDVGGLIGRGVQVIQGLVDAAYLSPQGGLKDSEAGLHGLDTSQQGGLRESQSAQSLSSVAASASTCRDRR